MTRASRSRYFSNEGVWRSISRSRILWGALSRGVGGSCETKCSSDLHSVVDCVGNVISTCPPDQGCGVAGCVPACDSAKANKSTIGCDYYSVPPDIISIGGGACFAAFVANVLGCVC